MPCNRQDPDETTQPSTPQPDDMVLSLSVAGSIQGVVSLGIRSVRCRRGHRGAELNHEKRRVVAPSAQYHRGGAWAYSGCSGGRPIRRCGRAARALRRLHRVSSGGLALSRSCSRSTSGPEERGWNVDMTNTRTMGPTYDLQKLIPRLGTGPWAPQGQRRRSPDPTNL